VPSQLFHNTLKDAKTQLDKVLPVKPLKDEQPLKAELFSLEQFSRHAKKLAEKHAVSFIKGREKLLSRLKENEQLLLQAHELLNDAGKAKRGVSPAGEWLLDNYYLVEEQIRLAQKHLPRGYSRELPNLLAGPMQGFPRVYDMAMELVSHGDGRLDVKGLTNFVSAYQTVKPLKLGELWAIPIMLRLALIENLRRVATRMMLSQRDMDKAEYWASRILKASADDASVVVLEIASMSKDDLPMSSSFVAEFVRRLHGQSSTLNLPLSWLEKKLAEQGKNIERLIRSTSQKQAADQVSIANTIESLRILVTTEWHDFVEDMSLVEKILKQDPSGDYPAMAFATRDSYRHVIEGLSIRSKKTESEVATETIRVAAEANVAAGHHDSRTHIGYYLTGKGREQLYRSLGIRLTLREFLTARVAAWPLVNYLGWIGGLSTAFTGLALSLVWSAGIHSWSSLILFGIPLSIMTSQTAISLVNWVTTLLVAPLNLPRMDFSEGIPAHAHTLVVVPCILSDAVFVDSLVENIEVRFLANTDANVDFALLSDFHDASGETMPGDEALLSQLKAGIEALNHKYRRQSKDVFYLFHRPRLWNAQEKVWMGYERKRGKLSDVNALLRGGGTDRFNFILGDIDHLQDVKYVITLDADTRMPRDVARELVGVIAHPLNRPFFDERKKRVTAGYGILQPRVEASYPGKEPSLFEKIFGGEPGIDPYTRAVSDVYQDLFSEGSFIGKGLYDVDAFENSLSGRFPENLVLSHDLLEGCYARSALVTDVQLYEEFPTSYLKDKSRRHRWIRGDWQIASYLLPYVLDIRKTLQKNPISALSKWKIFDNLRRSFVPGSTMLLFGLGWFFIKPSWLWATLIIALTGAPTLLMSLVEFTRKPPGITVRDHIGSTFSSLGTHTVQFIFSLVFLVYEAFVSLHAVLTTWWRLLISHRHLLEWKASAWSEIETPENLLRHFKKMWIAPVTVLTLTACLTGAGIPMDAFTATLLGIWLLSPAVATFISRSSPAKPLKLSVDQAHFLRRQSRRTWNYFENFVSERNNYLPPDNFQEKPVSSVARRTSPTNIGLSLLANLTAYDFGYVSMGTMFARTEKTFETMNSMERYRGHFYNWYHTETLQPLEPRYISSVDSGNLIGHLLVLRSGLLEMQDEKILPQKVFDGLFDTLDVLHENINELTEDTGISQSETIQKITKRILFFKQIISSPPASLLETYSLISQLSTDVSKAFTYLDRDEFEKTKRWIRVFEKQCIDFLEELTFLAPWILLAPQIPGMWDQGNEEQCRCLRALQQEIQHLDEIPTLSGVARLERKLLPLLDGILDQSLPGAEPERIKEWLTLFKNAIRTAGTRAGERIRAIENVAVRCGELSAVDYEFLYNKKTHLLSIGYRVFDHKTDPSCYDLLASEARLCSFVAIAQGQIPQEHWFLLGRLLSRFGGDPILVSWGGSMFEYLMPLLVMPNYEDTLLDRTYKAMIGRQIDYARRNKIPWGISESGYNKIDAAMVYQYRSFGVPTTGFKRGLSEDLVVAPYASVLALMVEPQKACTNLQYLTGIGLGGEYGFYEAVDYTPSRLGPDEKHAIVKSYMAHHQGMSFLSLAYVLLNKPMQRRFLSDPMFKATELLLQERVPKEVPYLYDIEVTGLLRKVEEREMLMRIFTTPDTPMPETHLLSNGRYSVMVTNAGGGYSRWKKIALTRWHEDAVLDNEGSFIYLRDVKTGEFWSSAYQPTLKKPLNYEAIFSQSRAEFKRTDHFIDTHTKVSVSPEDDVELRRVRITNRSGETRIIELTSYADVVLNEPAADLAHPAFSNLFIQTEIIRSHQAVICSRRPRSERESFPLMLHLMAVHGNSIVDATYETDRSKFIGRTNTLQDPAALQSGADLTNTEGPVIDPSVSIRCRVELEPDKSATIDFVTGICPDRENAQKIMEKYRDRNLADRVFDLAWTHGQVALHQIDATEVDAQLYGRMASAIVYANPAWRASASILRQNHRGQSDLWGFNISGDLPIVLVRIEDQKNISLIYRMVQAHSYWKMKGLAVDLLIWNEDASVYRDEMSEMINGLISANAGGPSDQPGGIFLRRTDQLSEEDKTLMQTVARIILTDRGGTLAEQISHVTQPKAARPLLVPVKKNASKDKTDIFEKRTDLVYDNGLGGFTPDGREYVITTGEGSTTPAPWVNVLANRDFGTVTSESGSAYTWSENAHEFRLTPWKNDPATDQSGEALYIRDEETGQFWSPTPLPAKGKGNYVSRHGFGYSIFEHTENGISTELTVFVSLNQSVKFAIQKIRNVSGRKRRLSTTSYSELVMGTLRDKYHMHIVTEVDPKSGALLAYNHYNKEFPDRVVFLDSSEVTRFVSGDRLEFLGRNGTLAAPAALLCDRLSGKTGAGFDPCAAMQVPIELEPDEEKEVTFTFGAGKSLDEARAILQHFPDAAAIKKELEAVWEYWKRSLGAISIETPDDSLNFLTNGWLQYQTISCRLWGRTGYYQSGGAFGFRDQLQDVMSLMHSQPSMVREQLLTFAAHQFVEGDAQHWWHPPSGRGIRSHCSDDFLWLPLVTSLYVAQIGDIGVLDESVRFLEGPPVKPEEESYYDLPKISEKTGTLYEHCIAAVERAISFGAHGLPLMGSGDWNDGMNLVGKDGKGESIWLAFFLYHVLKSMAGLSERHGDPDYAERCLKKAAVLAKNIEDHAWDGEWYHRAYFDNGDILGTAKNQECRIDSIPQSWAVISGAADQDRARMAIDQVDRLLVNRQDALIRLFTPPFDTGATDPGYIKGYVPGVRENGGQYSHAAVWAVMAFAMLKDSKRAWELLNIINPIQHSTTPDACSIYKVEPYVMAGDVYDVKSNAGRGGWTWYTGSASWMYQLIITHLLGIQLEVDRLKFDPCLPPGWKSYKIHYRYRETVYHINFKRIGSRDEVTEISVNGTVQKDKHLPLVNDRTDHTVDILIG